MEHTESSPVDFAHTAAAEPTPPAEQQQEQTAGSSALGDLLSSVKESVAHAKADLKVDAIWQIASITQSPNALQEAVSDAKESLQDALGLTPGAKEGDAHTV